MFQYRNLRKVVIISGIFVIALTVGSVTLAEYYFSQENMISDSETGYNQENPSVTFDSAGTRHHVWTDYRYETGAYPQPPYVFHRKIDTLGDVSQEKRTTMGLNCDVSPCGQDFGTFIHNSYSPDYGYVFCSNASSMNGYPVTVAREQISTDGWLDFTDTDVGAYQAFHYSACGSGNGSNYLFLASSNTDVDPIDIRFARFNMMMTPAWDQIHYLTSPTGAYGHVDIDSDADGYIYAVFVEYQSALPSTIQAVRSSQPYDVDSFEVIRTVGGCSTDTYPQIDAHTIKGSPVVAIVWVENGAVYTRVEDDSNWGSSTMNGYLSQVNAGNSAVSDKADVCVGNNQEVYVVWDDDRSANPEIYMAVSYDLGETYPEEQLLTTALTSHGDPKIALNENNNDICIAYTKEIGSTPYVHELMNLSAFYSQGNNFDDWTSYQDVTISSDQAWSDPTSFKFSGAPGELVKDFLPDASAGSFDFYFYDSLDINVDFRFEIAGSNGGKAGIVKMVGIHNDTDQAKYSAELTGVKAWTALEISRSQGWHHILVTVENTGTKIYFDPETNPTPIDDVASDQLTQFHSLKFMGGEQGNSAAYYVDDVRISRDRVGNAALDVPAMSPFGIGFLLVIIGGFLFRFMRRRG